MPETRGQIVVLIHGVNRCRNSFFHFWTHRWEHVVCRCSAARCRIRWCCQATRWTSMISDAFHSEVPQYKIFPARIRCMVTVSSMALMVVGDRMKIEILNIISSATYAWMDKPFLIRFAASVRKILWRAGMNSCPNFVCEEFRYDNFLDFPRVNFSIIKKLIRLCGDQMNSSAVSFAD